MTPEERPEWVKCIDSYRESEKPKTLCGEHAGFDFTFTSLDHWLGALETGSRLVGCPKCLERVRKALELNEKALE